MLEKFWKSSLYAEAWISKGLHGRVYNLVGTGWNTEQTQLSKITVTESVCIYLPRHDTDMLLFPVVIWITWLRDSKPHPETDDPHAA